MCIRDSPILLGSTGPPLWHRVVDEPFGVFAFMRPRSHHEPLNQWIRAAVGYVFNIPGARWIRHEPCRTQFVGAHCPSVLGKARRVECENRLREPEKRYGQSLVSVRTVSTLAPNSAISPEFSMSAALCEDAATAARTSEPSTNATPALVNTIDTMRFAADTAAPERRRLRFDAVSYTHLDVYKRQRSGH